MHLNYPPKFMEQVKVIIEQNLDNEHFTVEKLSRSLFLCNAQIFKKIKKQTGLNPSAYIRKIRLEHAKQLIEKSDLRLSEIIYMVGFNSLSHFSTSFSQKYGYPPSSLRSFR